MNKQPPKYLLRFFRWFCNPNYVDDIEGDLLERFEKKPSKWVFTLEVLKLLRPSLMKSFSGSRRNDYYSMFCYYLKIGGRNLLRRKSTALVNIGGLVIGLTITLLIALWMQDEFSFNRKNDHYDSIAKVMMQQTMNGDVRTSSTVPFPLIEELEKQYGDDFEQIVPSTWFGDYDLSKGKTVITTRGGFMGEHAPDLMSLHMVYGNLKSLSKESSSLLSESAAKALFGEEDPIGQIITTQHGWSMTVIGVFEDVPSNSSFHGVNFIGNWDLHVSSIQWINKANWLNGASFHIYVQLGEKTNIENTSQKIALVVHNNMPDEGKLYDTKIFLHPMKDWHLKSSWENGRQAGGDIQFIWWFGIIGAFVLLLACVNYMNLSTAQSIKRAKEVGIRKSLGTMRTQLIFQFLTESILIVFLAFLVSCFATFIALPFFNVLTNKEIVLPLSSTNFWLSGVVLAIVVGIISGIYPALYLSSFNATQVLKGTYQNTLSATFFRKFLIVFQFSIAITLIISTLIIQQQINHATKRPIGYNQDGTIMVRMKTNDHWQKNEVIKNDLMASGLISYFTQSSAPITEVWTGSDDISWEGMTPHSKPWFCSYFVNHNFGQTIDWEIIEGRDFSKELSSDSSSIIINEAAARSMQLKDPIGKTINQRSEKFKIIGVVKDILSESPFSDVRPTLYFINRGDMAMFQLLRLNPKISILTALEGIETVFEKHIPKTPFKYDFVSDVHNRKFRKIDRLGTMSRIFAALAIFISCLGLFGLASFMVEQRTKEIGIRKVLGASVLTLWRLVSKEFVLLVLLSGLIAIPISNFALSRWLESYEYRISLEWWVFASAVIGALVLTIATISFKSIGVAKLNPAKTLKDE